MTNNLLKYLFDFNPALIHELIAGAKEIGLDIKIVVLTGGPCAGKTDSLIHLETEFSKRGYQVVLLPEAATIIRSQGFRAEQGIYPNSVCQWMMMVQNEYSLMLAIVAAIKSHRKGEQRKMLIIRDRSTLDGAAYVKNREVFEASLRDVRFTIGDITFADVTIFLRSLAVDRPDLYEKFSTNNPIRFEDVSQASAADQRLLDIYEAYCHPHIIDNRHESYQDKLDTVVNTIVDALGEPRLEKELAFMVYDPDDSLIRKFGITSFVDITQIYTYDGRYRRIDYPGGMHSTFIHTLKIDTDDPDTRIETESRVLASDWIAAQEKKLLNHVPVKKRRFFKIIKTGDKYFILEIDYFSDKVFAPGWIRVEIEYGLHKPEVLDIFNDLCYSEVTGHDDCSNKGIANGLVPKQYLRQPH